MKSSLVAACLLASLLLLSALAPRGDASAAATPAQDELAARVLLLEEKVQQLEKENQASEKRLDEVVDYLHARADYGKTLLSVYDKAETLGYTAGINFESREVLLAGWRSFWNAQQKGLPKKSTPAGNGKGTSGGNGR